MSWILTVIRLRLMTSGGAASAGVSFLVIQGKRPLAECDPLGKHFRQRSSVRSMTCYATPPFEFTVNVQIVQIHIAVSEVCCIRCVGETEQVPVMAAETQLKLFIIIGDIKIRREFIFQQLDVRRSVGVVARGTTAGLDSPVDIRHRLCDDIRMAAKTKLFPWPEEKFLRVARMGRMTGNTPLLRHYRGMLHLRLLHRLLDFRMALVANLGTFRRKHLRVG
jgi:hypothetical protein